MGLSGVAFASIGVLFIICAQSAIISNNNNLILGSRQINDSLLFTTQTIVHPEEGIAIENSTVGVSRDSVNLTYVEALEYGDFPDAVATLLGGGPNFNFVSILLTTGPSRGLNYTVYMYGLELDTNDE